MAPIKKKANTVPKNTGIPGFCKNTVPYRTGMKFLIPLGPAGGLASFLVLPHIFSSKFLKSLIFPEKLLPEIFGKIKAYMVHFISVGSSIQFTCIQLYPQRIHPDSKWLEFELQLQKQFSRQTCQLSSLANVSTTQRATLAKNGVWDAGNIWANLNLGNLWWLVFSFSFESWRSAIFSAKVVL